MRRGYPVDKDAPCWGNPDGLAHDLVYLGLNDIALPFSIFMLPGAPDISGMNLPNFPLPPCGHPEHAAPLIMGPVTLALQRCVRCGIGFQSNERRDDARDPTEEERVWLRAIETVRLRPE